LYELHKNGINSGVKSGKHCSSGHLAGAIQKVCASMKHKIRDIKSVFYTRCVIQRDICCPDVGDFIITVFLVRTCRLFLGQNKVKPQFYMFAEPHTAV